MTLKVDPGLVDVLKLRFSHLEKIREPRHAKTGFELFFTVISTEGLVGTSPAKPSFSMTQIIELSSVVFKDILQAVSYQKKPMV